MSECSEQERAYFETLVAVAEMRTDLREVDLHGADVWEAKRQIDLELDRAFMAGEDVVKIIHGHGSGTLRREVEPYVRNHSHVLFAKSAVFGAQHGAVIYAVIDRK